ncbi:MAG: SdrD B-like domain-containing protein [Isosphaeraceae bacterium]
MRYDNRITPRSLTSTSTQTKGRPSFRDRRRVRALLGSGPERLEERALLSSVVGTVYDDTNGNGLKDVGEAGLAGVSVSLANYDPATGRTTAVGSVTSGPDGKYQFDVGTPGLYMVSASLDTVARLQTTPTAEHTARSYLLDVPAGDAVVGGDATLAAPVDNWLKALPASTYEFPVSGDFMLMLGPKGNAPARVFLTGAAVVRTQAPVITPASGGGESGETQADAVNVPLQMTQLVLRGYITSDQHGQGYLGPITITLSALPAARSRRGATA